MRRLLLTLIALSFATLSFAERLPRSERYALDGKENNIFLTLSSGFTGGIMGTQARLEYNRQLDGNWFWGISLKKGAASNNDFHFNYDDPYYDYSTEEYHPGNYSSEVSTTHKNLINVSGMAYYRIPIIKDRLMLRPGFGAGVCYYSDSTDYATSQDTKFDDVMMSYTIELAWILRLSKNFELKFSPLAAPMMSILPESMSYCRGLDSNNSTFSCDYLLNLGLGIRF